MLEFTLQVSEWVLECKARIPASVVGCPETKMTEAGHGQVDLVTGVLVIERVTIVVHILS